MSFYFLFQISNIPHIKHQPFELVLDAADLPSFVWALEVFKVVIAVDVDDGEQNFQFMEIGIRHGRGKFYTTCQRMENKCSPDVRWPKFVCGLFKSNNLNPS